MGIGDKRFMDVSSIISLEDMKEIINKSIKNAETWGDFYAGIIIGVYKLGLERGKITNGQRAEKYPWEEEN